MRALRRPRLRFLRRARGARSRLRVASELYLDHDDAASMLHGENVSVPVAERHLVPDDCQLRRARQRERVWSFLDDLVKRGLGGEAVGATVRHPSAASFSQGADMRLSCAVAPQAITVGTRR